MQRGLQGKQILISDYGEPVRAFIPAPLPPQPPVEWTPALRMAFEKAYLTPGRLDTLADILSEPHLLLYLYCREGSSPVVDDRGNSTSCLYGYYPFTRSYNWEQHQLNEELLGAFLLY